MAARWTLEGMEKWMQGVGGVPQAWGLAPKPSPSQGQRWTVCGGRTSGSSALGEVTGGGCRALGFVDHVG